ncbi:MAG: adenylate/guanylate cyclase domain-containing protein [Hyphomicrobiaceae bacterium]
MSREQRRLAAIVSADVAGYSRLMGRDESGTVARLRRVRTERLEPVLARRGGRVVKLTGDGALIEFGSAVEALSAAIEFQQAMAESEADRPEAERLVFRVGVHLGDVIVDGDDLYGDGVNVAARLEAEAPAGGIVISGDMHNFAAGRVAATFEDLGRLSLKNIERPMQAFAVRWRSNDWPLTSIAAFRPAIAAPAPPDTPLLLPDKPSIAVLPFQNMSGDPEQEYFADGMVEDIITGLSINKLLFVIARNSSFAYKGKSPDVRQVGRELGVRYVLEGSVRKAGNRVRITGQLIDATSGAHLWAERFDGDLDDIFDLQDQIASRVIGGIAPSVEKAEIERVKRKTDNLQAYDCYLRCRAEWYRMTPEGNRQALDFARRSVAIDPDFALGHAALALTHNHARSFDWMVNERDDIREAECATQKALELDRNDANVLAYCGQTLMVTLRRLEEGASLLDQAVTIDPNLALAWTFRAASRIALDHQDEAISDLERALRLSPLDPGKFYALTLLARANNLRGTPQQALPFAAESL